MSTYREVAYMVLDELKMMSDDSYYELEHVIFLLDKYRGMLLKKYYSDIKKNIPDSNLLTICLTLDTVNAFAGDVCSNPKYLKSNEKIPDLLPIGGVKLTSKDGFGSPNINYVDRDRFPYAGSSRYSGNMIYGTIASDSYLYMKSNNPQAYYLDKVSLTGIFEDAAKAAELSCGGLDGDNNCDILDKTYPLEEALIPEVIQLIVRELLGAAYRPADSRNDANDDLSDIIAWARRNMKNNLTRLIEDGVQ